jgi:hypothetical protein
VDGSSSSVRIGVRPQYLSEYTKMLSESRIPRATRAEHRGQPRLPPGEIALDPLGECNRFFGREVSDRRPSGEVLISCCAGIGAAPRRLREGRGTEAHGEPSQYCPPDHRPGGA